MDDDDAGCMSHAEAFSGPKHPDAGGKTYPKRMGDSRRGHPGGAAGSRRYPAFDGKSDIVDHGPLWHKAPGRGK